MTYKVRGRKINTSMLEIICTLGIFVVVGALVLKLFVGANSLETKASDISKACIMAESMADTIKGYSSIEEAMKELDLNQVQDNHTTAVYERFYDKDWNPVKKKGRYRATLTVEKQSLGNNDMYEVNIVIKSEKSYPIIKKERGNVLTSLKVCSYK